MIVALIIRQCGTNWIDIVLPTAAMGPVVALIGLELAGSAASTAGLLDENIDYEKCNCVPDHTRSCRIRPDPFPRFPVRYSDPDRDHRRLCCCCRMWNP